MPGHTVAVHTGPVKGVHSNRSETLVPVFIGVVVDRAVSSGDSSRLLLWPVGADHLHTQSETVYGQASVGGHLTWQVSRASCSRSERRPGRGSASLFVRIGWSGGGGRRAKRSTARSPAVPTKAFAGLDAWPRDARDEPTLAQPSEVVGGKYALSARSLTGRRRLGPRRDPTAGMPRVCGLRARLRACSHLTRRRRAGCPGHRTARAACCPSRRDRPDSAPSAIPLGANGGRVDDPRGPVHLAPDPEFVQHRPMQPTPQADLGPCREAAMRGGGGRAERRRQMTPGTAAGQHAHAAVNTARSARGAVPPPCGRAANDGKSGTPSSQGSSGTRRFDRSELTAGIMPLEHQVTRDSPLRLD
jgi:hypothetical protein